MRFCGDAITIGGNGPAVAGPQHRFAVIACFHHKLILRAFFLAARCPHGGPPALRIRAGCSAQRQRAQGCPVCTDPHPADAGPAAALIRVVGDATAHHPSLSASIWPVGALPPDPPAAGQGHLNHGQLPADVPHHRLGDLARGGVVRPLHALHSGWSAHDQVVVPAHRGVHLPSAAKPGVKHYKFSSAKAHRITAIGVTVTSPSNRRQVSCSS